MALPKPAHGEDDSKFISRCVAELTSAGEYDTEAQRTAACHAQLPKAKTIDPPYAGDSFEVDRADEPTEDTFDPDQPRDKDGKFGSGGGGPRINAEKHQQAMHEATTPTGRGEALIKAAGGAQKPGETTIEYTRRLTAARKARAEASPKVSIKTQNQAADALKTLSGRGSMAEIKVESARVEGGVAIGRFRDPAVSTTESGNEPSQRDIEYAIPRYEAAISTAVGPSYSARVEHADKNVFQYVIELRKKDRADDDDTMEVDRSDFTTLPKTTRTDEGFLRAPATRVARVGVQEYRRADGTIQRELRLPEYVFEASSLGTLDGKPVTLDHPKTRVDSTNARTLGRGNVSNPREDAEFITADLTIHDAETIEAVDKGAKEVSLGYRTRLVPIVGGVFNQPGSPFDGTRADFLQTKIRHNHAAVLPRGRANEGTKDRPVRIRTDGVDTDVMRLDGAGNQITVVDKTPSSEGKKDMMLTIDGVEYDLPEAVCTYIESLKKGTYDAAAKADVASKKVSEQEARADAAEQKLAELEKATTDASEAERGVGRFALMKQAEGLVKRPLAELVRMDEAGLRRAILAAKCPKLRLDGKDDSYVEAYLDREIEAEKATKNSASDLRGVGGRTAPKSDAGDSPLMKAYADRAAKNGRSEVKE